MRVLVLVVALLVAPAAALAQPGAGMGAMPLAIDVKKIPVGSWAEYGVSMGPQTGKLRWALVARDADGATVEMTTETPRGKIAMKIIMVLDPVNSPNPIKKIVTQEGDKDPMEMPPMMMANAKFQKPDPKKLVGKESVKVSGGTFKASHYRDEIESATIDIWINESVPPFGIVKQTVLPKASQQLGTMELVAHGKDAKPVITKPAKPFDPSMMGGPGPGPSAPAPKPAPSAPTPAPSAPPKKP
jgi:hypothetical protein